MSQAKLSELLAAETGLGLFFAVVTGATSQAFQ